VMLLLEPVNLLILDEPTNHLDMRSKEILKKALIDFEGTVILVSHDREFLEGLVNRVLEFDNKKIKEHLGGIYEFLNKKKLENLKELEVTTRPQGISNIKPTENKGKISFEERKEINRQIKKVTVDIESAEVEIAQLEKKLAAMDEILQNPSQASMADSIYGDYEQVRNHLASKMENWETLHQKLEEMEDQRKLMDVD